MRRTLLLLSAGMFVVGCFSLYMMLELQMPPRRIGDLNDAARPPDSGGGGEGSPLRNNELNNIEVKIKQIEDDLKRNHQTISDIRSALHGIVKGDPGSIDRLRKTFLAVEGSVQRSHVTRALPRRDADTRFVMPSDKRPGQSPMMRPIANNANKNLSKPCLLSRSQSKVVPVKSDFSEWCDRISLFSHNLFILFIYRRTLICWIFTKKLSLTMWMEGSGSKDGSLLTRKSSGIQRRN